MQRQACPPQSSGHNVRSSTVGLCKGQCLKIRQQHGGPYAGTDSFAYLACAAGHSWRKLKDALSGLLPKCRPHNSSPGSRRAPRRSPHKTAAHLEAQVIAQRKRTPGLSARRMKMEFEFTPSVGAIARKRRLLHKLNMVSQSVNPTQHCSKHLPRHCHISQLKVTDTTAPGVQRSSNRAGSTFPSAAPEGSRLRPSCAPRRS